MLEKIEAKINSYIEQLLNKETLTVEDYHILTSEYTRLRNQKDFEKNMSMMMSILDH